MRIASQTFHTCATAALLFLLPAADATGQIRYDRGQNVAPVYEGWIQNADGTFTMVFGYMNRNWEEGLDIPVGPDNRIEPGGPDYGQPTYFYPRRNRFVFRVPVPDGFEVDDEMVWTLTVNGVTDQAFATLLSLIHISEPTRPY